MNCGLFLLLVVSQSVAEQVSVTVEDTEKGIQAAWNLFLKFEKGDLTAAQVKNSHESIKLAGNRGEMKMSCWVQYKPYRFNCGVDKNYLLNEGKVKDLMKVFKEITHSNSARIHKVQWKEPIQAYQANAVCRRKKNKYLFNYHIPVKIKNGLLSLTALFFSST